MRPLVPRLLSLVSKLSARIGSRIAWYLWFHPHGRPRSRMPAGAADFSLHVVGHEVSGFTLGSGETVLLLHGWGGASTDMGPLAEEFADAGYRAVVPDLPGHGLDRGSYADVFRMAASVDAVGQEFGAPRAVVAHSFGAVVTFASFPHGGPERVVLIAPAVRGQRFLDGFASQVGLGDRAFGLFRQRFERFAGPHLMAVFAGRGDVPGADMLVLHDPADDRTPFGDAAAYARDRAATKLVDVPGSGHKGILRAAVTRQEALSFVAGSSRPRS